MSYSKFVLSSSIVAAFLIFTADSARAQATSSPALDGLEGLLTPPLVAVPGQPTLSSAASVPGVLNSDGTVNPVGAPSQGLSILDDEDDQKKRRGGRSGSRRGGGGGGGGGSHKSTKPTTTQNHTNPSTSTKHNTGGNQPAHSGQNTGTTKQSPPIVKYRQPGTLKSSAKHSQNSARITPKHNAPIGRPAVGRIPLAKQVTRSHQAGHHASGGHRSATSAAMAARHGKGAAGSRHHASTAPAHHHGGGGGHHGGGGGGHHGGGGGGGGAGGGGGGH